MVIISDKYGLVKSIHNQNLLIYVNIKTLINKIYKNFYQLKMETKSKENYPLLLFLFILKIIVVNSIIINNTRNLTSFNSEIHLVILGNGFQQICL